MPRSRDQIHKLTTPYLLHNAWVLQDLPEKDRLQLEQQAQQKSGKRGETLFKAGSYPKSIYWLIRGKIKIFQESTGGQKSINYIYTDGDLVAYRQFIANEPHPVTGTLLEDSQYMLIPGDAFKGLLTTSPIFAKNIMTALAQDFTIWMNRMTAFSTYAVRERVILSLLILSVQYESPGSSPGVITLTRTDLAEYVGATLETVVRVLNKLKSEKLVAVDGRRIVILNASGLSELLSF